MRGKHRWVIPRLSDLRNIPAYAGKTPSGKSAVAFCPEHPRVCGENHSPPFSQVVGCGTSPRMRGKRPMEYPGEAWIPEHPRVCGENVGSAGKHQRDTGTSPRMRGKLLVGHLVDEQARNIPAYAGKTHRCADSHHAGEEHPRVCGENQPRRSW